MIQRRIFVLVALLFVSRAWADAPTSAREAFLKLIDRPRVDPSPVVKDLEPLKSATQQHITITTEPGQKMPFLFIKPDATKPGQKLPAVLVLHGTSSRKESNRALAARFAANGIIGIAPDGRYHGERCAKGTGTDDYFPAIAQAYKDGKRHPWLYDTVYDLMRLIDYLATREDVDPKRIGVIGFSKGGMETYLLAAADTRVAVAVPCIAVQSYQWALDNDHWKSRIYTVGGAAKMAAKEEGIETIDKAFCIKFYDRVVPGIYTQFDCPTMLRQIAPRPLLAINGDTDDKTPVEGVKVAAKAAQEAYEKAGAADRFKLIIQEKTGHSVSKESQTEAVEWFKKWL